MIGSVFSIPSLLDSVGEETVNDMLQTFIYMNLTSISGLFRDAFCPLKTGPLFFFYPKIGYFDQLWPQFWQVQTVL